MRTARSGRGIFAYRGNGCKASKKYLLAFVKTSKLLLQVLHTSYERAARWRYRSSIDLHSIKVMKAASYESRNPLKVMKVANCESRISDKGNEHSNMRRVKTKRWRFECHIYGSPKPVRVMKAATYKRKKFGEGAWRLVFSMKIRWGRVMAETSIAFIGLLLAQIRWGCDEGWHFSMKVLILTHSPPLDRYFNPNEGMSCVMKVHEDKILHFFS